MPMNSKHSEGSAVAVVVILVLVALAVIVLLVGAAGFFWYRLSYQRALQAEEMAARAMEEAERHRVAAEAEAYRTRRELGGEDLIARVQTSEARLETVEKHVNLIQAELDEARRAWKEIIERTGGQLAEEDIDDIDLQIEILQDRLIWMHEVFK
jgi:uncharacterized protein HemX